MNRPELYRQVNKIQRRDAQAVIQEYAEKINWRMDGNDTVLDAGCGPGDVTMDILLPVLPSNFRCLIGIDISKAMIDHAQKTQIHSKVSFEQFDLGTELEVQTLDHAGPFDHIFSFHTFHRVPDKLKCMQNFYQLLDPNGDMLLLFPANHPLHDVYKEQSLDNKWAEYLTDIDRIMPSFQYSKDPCEEFRELLNKCGFTKCDIQLKEVWFTFESFNTLREFLLAVNPFIDRLPDEHIDSYLDDLVLKLTKRNSIFHDENNNVNAIGIPYKKVVAYVRK